MRVGLLALQGAFIEHGHAFQAAGHDVFEIRQTKDIQMPFEVLVLPGGESTVQRKLLFDLNLAQPLWDKIDHGLKVYATCAGMILLAKTVDGLPNPLGRLDICVTRNAYGRQLASFKTVETLDAYGRVPMTFIRAPKIVDASDQVEILSRFDDAPTTIRQNNITAFSWHPELNGKIYYQ
ncbi:MAG: pyridoxal 5'-phosphate synthase glutaminase subunit PdxT [Proteobacteria bacterium]|jgi:5'-phosphate synthase pdxT subunit|nr:pyridoxal 5'-phosphate synthase glutaminase subunit PdxT [Pseudomonadota bacterium]